MISMHLSRNTSRENKLWRLECPLSANSGHGRRLATLPLGLSVASLCGCELVHNTISSAAPRLLQDSSPNRDGWPMQKILAVASLCGAIAFLHPGEAGAQCEAKDSLQYVVAPRSGTAAVPSAEAVRKVWKTITLGRFANTFALRNALDAAGCGIGDLAEQILARPAFTLNPVNVDVDLVVVSGAELGMPTESSLADVYARAQSHGLALAPAEVGPLLRLQYLDQSVGEFLHVGMTPINTWAGEPVILVLVNGEQDLSSSAQRAVPTQKYPRRPAFCSSDLVYWRRSGRFPR